MIEWKGGECPVEGMVRVLTRDGHVFVSPASDLEWEVKGMPSDILSYCIDGGKKMKASGILRQGQSELEDRAVTYDAPGGERSMAKTVEMFNVLTGLSVTEVQGWQFMELLKMVRSSQGAFKLDNFVDGSVYAALAGEAANV